MRTNLEIPEKICRCCKREMVEMFDSYTETCPECDTENTKLLVNSQGTWIWE